MLRRGLYVASLDERLIPFLETLYRGLSVAGASYRVSCRGGRCTAAIEGAEPRLLEAVLEAPGLVVGECSLSTGCPEPGGILPPPPAPVPPRPRGLPRRGFRLGVAGPRGVEARLDPETLKRHLAVVGSTGAGKSHTAARIAACSARTGYAVYVIDWHGEYRGLLSSLGVEAREETPPAPMAGGGLSLEDSISIAEEVLDLSPQQALLLTALLAAKMLDEAEAVRALSSIYSETTAAAAPARGSIERIAAIIRDAADAHDLFRAALEAYRLRMSQAPPKGETEVWAALLRRLGMIGLDPSTGRYFTLEPQGQTEPRPGTVTIIAAHRVPGGTRRKLYTLYTIAAIHIAAARTGTPTLIVVDEAHNIARTRTLEHILSDARKMNTAITLVLHTPRLLTPQAAANINTWIIHRVTSRDDIRALEAVLPSDYAELLPRLPQGAAVYTTPEAQEPAVLRVYGAAAPC